MKINLLICFSVCFIVSCDSVSVTTTVHEGYSQSIYHGVASDKENVTITVTAWSQEFEQAYPVVVRIRDTVFVPDTLGPMVRSMSPGNLSGKAIYVPFADTKMEEIPAEAGDSVVISIDLQPSDYEYIQTSPEYRVPDTSYDSL